MHIGSKLKRLREIKNLKQEDVAKRLNISKQAYSKIERDETKLDIQRIMDLSEIFEVSAEELLRGESCNVNLNQPKECNNQQFSGNLSTINNHYYYGNEITPLLQKTIESQQETIKRLESELLYLRKLLEEQLGKK
jgi:transcriptional regulator with XRE-family HTH domain